MFERVAAMRRWRALTAPWLAFAASCGSAQVPAPSPSHAPGPTLALAPAPAHHIAPACRSPEARQFDFWIGEWTVQNQHRSPRASADATLYPTGTAVDRVYAILDGCAIVEHWQGHLAFADVFGFSLRAYDPDKGVWQLVGHWPIGRLAPLGYREGSFAGGVGDFVYQDRSRFRFKDITGTSLTWEGADSSDGGKTWSPSWVMHFTRRDPMTERGILVGPPGADTAPFCAGQDMRRFDFLLGAWEGTTDGGQPVEVHGYRLDRGCTLMDFATIGSGAGAYKWFQVRAYDPAEQRWVQYALSNRDPTLQRLAGGFTGATAKLSGPRLRERWTGIGGQSLAWELTSTAGEPPVQIRATLRRRGPL